MVSCRSLLTYFISYNGFFFVFVHPFLPSTLLSNFLLLFLSFFSFFLPRSTLTSPYRRCCPAGSTDCLLPTSLQHHDCLLPTSPPASRLLTSDLPSSHSVAYFRHPPPASQLLSSDLPSSHTIAYFRHPPPASRLLTSDLHSRPTIAYFQPPLQLHDCSLPISPQVPRLLTSDLLPSSLPTIRPVI
jgi:hypothetical protein